MKFILINGKEFYLGKLCNCGHEYQETGKSLRYKPFGNRRSGPCVECHRKESRSRTEYYKKRYQQKKDAIKDNVKKWRTENPDKVKISQDKYRMSQAGKLTNANLSRRRRARKANNHAVNYSKNELFKAKEIFCNECAYCGSKIKLQIDHFIPVSKGGSDCIGNFVLSCWKCNRSKSDNDPMEWYKSQDFYSSKRWKQILKILGKNESNYTQIPLL
ncbi:HNH endonuclease [Cylindrospermum stagnale PCC 7417]|uniref:HNH endonuclease n=1 Tax=Cylindrospermum stagnale PCC 7417 TaxID=56107 RepID=K9X538_9NOST|nr:HNH endonuclease [Cylindrospermum stagnale]AFZ27219.1 HNH endonuclease [Cylindrospermum stagnale PCC 7417]